MKSIEDEFKEIDRLGDWPRLFQQIKTDSSTYDYSFKDARKSENKNLNRYRDVSPYDHSRVKLYGGNCDYINASLVQVPQARRTYILAQGPLPHTASHFWQMTWEQNSKAILMLNKVIEKNQVKCHQYWPLGRANGGEDEMIFKDIRLKVQLRGNEENSFYTLRRLKLTHLETQEVRTVLHFHYTTWPDFGVPESPWEFLIFLLIVRNAGVLDENVGPAIVHCSAGIGRSGTFCLVDSCLVLIEQNRNANSINIKEILMDMRKYRMGLIQTPDQLRFSYLAIIEGGKRILSGTFTENALFNEELNKHRSRDRRRNSSERITSTGRGSSSSQERRRSAVVTHSRSSSRRNSSADRAKDSSPPPLPPRRIKDGASYFETESNNCVHSYANDFKLSSLDTVLSDAELRRRIRLERNTKTSERIEQIKQRQQESETWHKRRSTKQSSDTSPEIPPKRRRSYKFP
uniref:protein-tyrosine-phosphatase n=1 Tax=Strigamia maritima TaxID=126957 RepID=T1IJ27_STRMM